MKKTKNPMIRSPDPMTPTVLMFHSGRHQAATQNVLNAYIHI